MNAPHDEKVWQRLNVHRFEPRPKEMEGELVTEDSAAAQFVSAHGADLRFCHTSMAWFQWNGFYWEKSKTGVALHWARLLARQLAEGLGPKERLTIGKTSFAGGVERFAKVDQSIAVTHEFWNSDPWLLGVPEGTVDLRTGQLKESRREDGITKITSVSPADAPCALWLKFLSEATGNDQGLIGFLQRWCGYCLTGMTTEHALIFVYGPGGNGKSVFLNILRHILQHYSAVAAMTTFMASQSDKHPTDVAMLDGSRLVTASETEEGHAWAESRIKQMTGGDPISARFMRQDFFTFQPQFKLTIVGNHKPALKNVDDAIRRRFLIVPFVRKPEKPDRELEQKLIQEAPSILGWMIEGCTEWQSKGLQPPESVMAATREYFGDQDLFAHWLEDECDTDKENIDMSMSSSEAFASWRDYCRSAGAQPGSAPSFKDKMTTEGFKFIKGRKSREFFGIRLKPKINYQV